MNNKEKKHVKLAVIRDNEADMCPFALNVPWACHHAGEHVQRMMPIDKLQDAEEKEAFAKANNRLLTWSLMQETTEPQRCFYLAKAFPDKDKVDCSYGDTAAGVQQSGSLLGSPMYAKHFTGVGLDGLYSIPLAYYSDGNISRNLFMSLYSYTSDKIDIFNLLKTANDLLTERCCNTHKSE